MSGAGCGSRSAVPISVELSGFSGLDGWAVPRRNRYDSLLERTLCPGSPCEAPNGSVRAGFSSSYLRYDQFSLPFHPVPVVCQFCIFAPLSVLLCGGIYFVIISGRLISSSRSSSHQLGLQRRRLTSPALQSRLLCSTAGRRYSATLSGQSVCISF